MLCIAKSFGILAQSDDDVSRIVRSERRVKVVMINQDQRLFCRLDGLATATREQQRMLSMADLGLLEAESVPVFDETTQTAAHFLHLPICLLALMEPERQVFKAAVGLSRLGLMNPLATSRQLARSEAFCAYVVDSQQGLAIDDTLAHPAFANGLLTQQYGVRAYLGVPLITSDGTCIGTLAVMDTVPHTFTSQNLEFLQLMARWSMSEYERQRIVQRTHGPTSQETTSTATQLKVELLNQLTQELRTPLTSVMGMASMLMREIYGPLTGKQKEYLGIVHNSGQYLLSLVNEILELADFQDSSQALKLAAVDIEMLCQQALGTLEQAAQRRDQQVRLTVEPGRRIWLLDKDKIRQMLYHLIFSVIQSSTAGSIVRLHVSRKETTLNLSIWVSHPWLGEGLPYAGIPPQPTRTKVTALAGPHREVGYGQLVTEADDDDLYEVMARTSPPPTTQEPHANINLALTLSQQLAELHQGQVLVQGSVESGYRYVVSLPQLQESDGTRTF